MEEPTQADLTPDDWRVLRALGRAHDENRGASYVEHRGSLYPRDLRGLTRDRRGMRMRRSPFMTALEGLVARNLAARTLEGRQEVGDLGVVDSLDTGLTPEGEPVRPSMPDPAVYHYRVTAKGLTILSRQPARPTRRSFRLRRERGR